MTMSTRTIIENVNSNTTAREANTYENVCGDYGLRLVSHLKAGELRGSELLEAGRAEEF